MISTFALIVLIVLLFVVGLGLFFCVVTIVVDHGVVVEVGRDEVE